MVLALGRVGAQCAGLGGRRKLLNDVLRLLFSQIDTVLEHYQTRSLMIRFVLRYDLFLTSDNRSQQNFLPPRS